MNRDELLTNLAMELSEWPQSPKDVEDDPSGWWLGDNKKPEHGDDFHRITEEDWLQRRTELINKPSWDDHDWPKIVQDDSGNWWGVHQDFKMTISHEWKGDTLMIKRGEGEFVCHHNSFVWPIAGHDWRETLEERPQPQRSTTACDDQHAPDPNVRRFQRGTCTKCGKQTTKREGAGEAVCAECRSMGTDYGEDSDAEGALSVALDSTNPSHYRAGAVECIDALKAATVNKTGIQAVCTANAIKYLWRYEAKGGAEDVRKARWYLERLLREMGEI